MMRNMKPDFKAAWEPRIGPEATLNLWNAREFIPLFWISWAAGFATVLVALATRTMPLWLSIVGSVAILAWVLFVPLTWVTYSIRVRRAARQAYDYLGRPPQFPRGKIQNLVLRDIATFDTNLVYLGIPPRGQYASVAGPAAFVARAKREARTRGEAPPSGKL